VSEPADNRAASEASDAATGPAAVAPYGSWRSPVTAKLLAEGGVGTMWPQSVGQSLYWAEMRPLEEGRYAVVRRGPGGDNAEVTPPGMSARTLVHEYGGGAYVAFRNERGGESVIFSGFADQRLYRQDLAPGGAAGEPGGAPAEPRWSAPHPITPAPPAVRAWRYADGRVTHGGELLVCIRERHEADGSVVNELVSLPPDGSAPPRIVAQGHDFYAAPRPSPDGASLAWLCWDHPLMPWDGTELCVAALAADGTLSGERVVAGARQESVLQPAWSPTGRLHFASDRSGWWNLYVAEPAAATDGGPPQARPLAPRAAEFAKAPWVFGLQHYAFLGDGTIVTSYTENGSDHLALIGPAADEPAADRTADRTARSRHTGSATVVLRAIPTAYASIASLTALGDHIGMVAASHTESAHVVDLEPRSGACIVVRRGRPAPVDPGYVSRAEPIAFPTEGGLTAHANYYAPTNPAFVPPTDERPPLLVVSHGGPTSAHEAALSLDVQYWTSRGFAVVDVNYGGSTGYGRAYRERLRGQWGVVDTVDCIEAARYLIARGDADPARVAVRGASAGGYTTLNALTRFRFFTAGASYFGLADLEAFAHGGTHKFESRYLDSLVGPYPETLDTYRERSPINHVDSLSCPVIVLQGLEDAIVPPAQAEMIVAALSRKGLPHAYLPFAGEQHGFRKAANIVRAQEAELFFYGRVFGFAPDDEIEPLAIANLD